jgi:hypothetical protein
MKNSLILSAFIFLILFSCNNNKESVDPSSSQNGTGGSLARITLVGNYLYMVDDNILKTFDVATPGRPRLINQTLIIWGGGGIETIFGRGGNLFIGSESGMYIYSLNNPSSPEFISLYWHVTACDPVIADSNYAYVTLRSENSRCNRFTNQLDIIDISDLQRPTLIRTYGMTKPKGLGKDGHLLFVCDNGLKVYNASDVMNLTLQNHFPIMADDVIPMNGNLMVIGSDGLYQYDYTGSNINLLSKLNIVKTY